MDDRRAALLLALLTLAGAGVRLALAPSTAAAPGDVRLVARDTPPPGPRGLSATARTAAWREKRGLFGELARFDSVPGVGPKLDESLRPYLMFSGVLP